MPKLPEGLSEDTFAPIPSTRDFWAEVAKGNVSGHSLINKFGRNTDIDTGTDPEDIWDQGGLHVPPNLARIHDIVSTDANDTSAGTGARTIRVEGISSGWAAQAETITMNGTTNVPTTLTYHRIHRMYLLTAGSGEVNAGNITATAQTDATVTAQITASMGQTLMAIYTVPLNKTGYLTNIWGAISRSSPAGANIELELYLRSGLNTVTPAMTVKTAFSLSIDGSNPAALDSSRCPISCTGPCDVILRVATVSDSNTGVTGGFYLLEVD